MRIKIPYHTGFMEAEIPRISGIYEPHEEQEISGNGEDLVAMAIENPIGSEKLSVLAQGKKKFLLITSDHTRPVPSRITCPALLREIRRGTPDAEIKIIVATGLHRAMTQDEITERFGQEIAENEQIIMHDGTDDDACALLGILPSGGELWINKAALWADMIVAEGFIEPHFFAGFSGGRKAVLPGIASGKTVLYNHNSGFIAHPAARAGCLTGNPIHEDMVWAARKTGLEFILNVTLDKNKKIAAAFAGDFEKAHEAGCAWLSARAGISGKTADIVITSNGGYPLDQNLYQAVKAMTAGEAMVRQDGIIIMCAGCADGHGGEDMCAYFSGAKAPDAVWDEIMAIPPEKTRPDQWQAQILARVMKKARVILVSDMLDEKITADMGIIQVKSLDEAFIAADKMIPGGSIAVVPDGVAVIAG